MISFQEKLTKGKTCEQIITRYLVANGNVVLPVYEISEASTKGPQLFCAKAGIVAPDMLVFSPGVGQPTFTEVKYKSVFSYHYTTAKWTTGIGTYYLDQYRKAKEATGLPIEIFFYHIGSTPSDSDLAHRSPKECPTGLFAGEIDDLLKKIHHTYRGMTYWAYEDLHLLAPVQEVLRVAGGSPWS